MLVESTQNVRLVIIALVSVVAIVASVTRRRMQHALTNAQVTAEKTKVIEQQAHTDSMTGLLNRRGLTRAVAQLESGHRSLAIIDCDKLKNVNDTHGHLVGDEFITAIAKRLANGVSSHDIVARWGGDEFIVVMSAPAPESAAIVQRIMAKVSDTAIATSAGPILATVTAGLADWPADYDIDEPLRLADNAMYEAKQAGRGTLVTSSVSA